MASLREVGAYLLYSLRGLTAREALEKKAVSSAEWKHLKQGSAGEYARLKESFTAKKFDADFITDLALEAQMRYVNFTTRHLGDLYMFRTCPYQKSRPCLFTRIYVKFRNFI